MKLRAIHLKNVRRFEGESASIVEIGDGVTSICAPNESGKSTFFDALRMLFTYKHSQQVEELRSLQPDAGGAVEIAADIELEGGSYRISKSFLRKKAASVRDLSSDRLVAQDDEAEAWIEQALGADAKGPTGLLWVRQGLSVLDPEGSGTKETNERNHLRKARRDLMSTVAGEVDAVTGGRRMDEILRRCEEDLGELATKNLSPKTGGPWADAVKEAERLKTRSTDLEKQIAELSGALQDREREKRELGRMSDPEEEQRRKEKLKDARAALDAARGAQAEIQAAEQARKVADLEAKAAEGDLSRLVARRRERETALKTLRTAEGVHEGAADDLKSVKAQLETTRKAEMAAQEVVRSARKELHAAERQRKVLAARRRRDELKGWLARLDALATQEAQAKASLACNPVNRKLTDKVEKIWRELALARTQRDAARASVCLSYSGDARARINEEEIAEGAPVPIMRDMRVELPGIGWMDLSPGEGRSDTQDASIEDLEAQLAEALDEAGCTSREEVQRRYAQREQDERDEKFARDSIDVIAPDGADKLREEKSALDALADQDADDRPVDEAAVSELVSALEDAEGREVDARAATSAARDEETTAEAALASARTSLDGAKETLERLGDDEGDEKDRQAACEAALEAAKQSLQDAGQRVEELKRNAPDVDLAEAEASRLESVLENAAAARRDKVEAIRILDGMIQARAEDGVEEAYQDVTGQLGNAEARAARYKAEVDALVTLRDALLEARSAARDAYFGPVKRELEALLSMLHEDAEIEMDEETMAPGEIVRAGRRDGLGRLSGGAAEQIAILTRLAFARLFARDGRPMPVILDDPLAYADDDRILKMFTALTHVARDQQILVFSCRNRAFEELGGVRARIRIATPNEQATAV